MTHVITLETEKKEDPRLIVEAFKESEYSELTSFKRLRVQNIQVRNNVLLLRNQSLPLILVILEKSQRRSRSGPLLHLSRQGSGRHDRMRFVQGMVPFILFEGIKTAKSWL